MCSLLLTEEENTLVSDTFMLTRQRLPLHLNDSTGVFKGYSFALTNNFPIPVLLGMSLNWSINIYI